MKKRLIQAVILTAVAIGMLTSGCSAKKADAAEDERIQVVATIGMIADVVKNIGGEHVAVHGLMGPGVDPHLYKATPSDVQALQKADIIFYNGLHLEAKMGELFEKMAQTRTTIAVSRGVDESKLMPSEDYEGLSDPHVWFDVTLWQEAAREIARGLSEQAPEHRQAFSDNLSTYMTQLDTLHTFALNQFARVPKEQRILITAHDAFNYFGKAYGFEVVGLQGISTQSEAGTGDVQKLVNLIVDRKVRAIFVESSVPLKNIKAVQEAVKARGWDVQIGGELFSDAMGDGGTFEGTYIGMVTHNVNTIVESLTKEPSA